MPSKFKPCTALIGGGVGALDAIDGAALADGDAAMVVTDSGVYHYHLNATGGETESSPYVIVPDANPGTKNWELVMPQGAFSHVRADSDVGQSIPDATETTIIFEDEFYDILSEYDHTTGIFTAIYAGYYNIQTAYSYISTSFTTGKVVKQFIYQDAVLLSNKVKEVEAAATMELGMFTGLTCYLDVGETLLVKARQNTGGAVALISSSNRTWLTIDRIA